MTLYAFHLAALFAALALTVPLARFARHRSLRQPEPGKGTLRTGLSAFWLLVPGQAAVVAHASLDLTGTMSLLAGLALTVLVVVSAFVSLVDLDSLQLDLAVFWPGALLGVAAAALVAAGPGGGTLLFAALFTLGVCVFLELVSAYVSWRVGETAMGFGDTQILVLTAFVPVALTGSWAVGWYALPVAGALAGTGYALRLLQGRGSDGASPQMAFGPALTLAVWPAWALASVLGYV